MNRLILLLVTFLSLALHAQDVPEQYSDIFMRINEQPGKAVDRDLEKLRKQHPKDPWVYWLSGVNVDMRDNAQAEAFYRESISVDSTFAPGCYNLAIILDSEEKKDEVMKLLNKAIRLNPNDGYYLLYRGQLYYDNQDYQNAMADAQLAKTKPDFFQTEADRLIVKVLYAQGNREKLHSYMRQARFTEESGMWEPDFDMTLATIYIEMGEPEKACICYNHAEEMYTMIDEEVPAEIRKKVDSCK